MFRRFLVGVGVSCLVFLAVVGNAWGQVRYTVTDLGGGGALGINNSGQVVGQNAAGHAFLYSGGTMSDLGALGGTHSQARSINNNGQIVGYAENASGNAHAFLYSGNGPMQSLGTLPNGSLSTAFAINNNGQTVGYADSSGPIRAFICSGNGPMQDLGVLTGSNTWATSINDNGLMAGYYQYSSVHIGFLYNSNTGLVESMGSETEACDVNNVGQVVGNVRSYVNGSNDHAMLYSNGQMRDLNNLIAPSSGWTLEGASAINDNGQIVGLGLNPSGQYHAYLLTPTPEPSTFVLLGIGAISLLAYASRRRRKLHNLRSMILAAMVVVLAAGSAQPADVFNMGGTRNPTTGTWTGTASLEFVTVGNPGNAGDTTGYGSVPYTYQMGKYDVTVGQYTAFLNAVAKTDTYGLYHSSMAAAFPTIKITQSGGEGYYSYSATGGYSQGVNCPITGDSSKEIGFW